jgi:hypothetical protein
MGGTCGTYGREGQACTGIWWRQLKDRDNLEDLDVDERIILKWWRCNDWIDLAEERDRWGAVVNLRVPKNAGNSFSWEPVSFPGRTLFHAISYGVS